MPKPIERRTLSDGTPIAFRRPDAVDVDKLRTKLLETGTVRWDECHEPVPVDISGYTETYTLACPLCGGTIVRISDRTPGDKEAWFRPCKGCGLTGDGSTLDLATAKRP